MIVRKFGFGFRGQLVAGWLLFAVAHFDNSIESGLCAGFVGGFYIAFTYANWRQSSFRTAFLMTIAIHALHNLLCA
jgi:hypothetical protein